MTLKKSITHQKKCDGWILGGSWLKITGTDLRVATGKGKFSLENESSLCNSNDSCDSHTDNQLILGI